MAANPSGPKTHVCSGCEFPIAVYGRLQPCLHIFCLQCTSKLTKCAICQQDVGRIERVDKGETVFVSPLTLQSFTSEQDLHEHIAAIQRRMSS